MTRNSLILYENHLQRHAGTKIKGWHTWTYTLLASLLLGAVALAGEPGKGYVVDPVPGWVKVQTYDSRKASAESPSVQYLLVDQQQRLLQDTDLSPPQYYHHIAQRLLNSAGLSQNSQIQISFNPAYQTLHLHTLRLIRDGVVRDVAQQVYVRMIQQEEQLDYDIHDGVTTAVLIPEDVRAGDIIDYSYTIEGSNPIFGNRHFGSNAMNLSVAVDKLSMRILTDAEQLTFRGVGVELKPMVGSFRGLKEYSIVRTNVPAVYDDGETSPEYTQYAWISFSEYPTWSDVNRWAARLYSGKDKITDKVRALAQRLRQQSSSDEDFITRALFFVQNEIRYIGLELGENSHRPSAPREVLKKRYGDCKDKSLLLVSLLNSQGIPAWPALVSTGSRHGIVREPPSPGAFDHVVTMVDFKGKRYWLDGTRLLQAGGLDDLGFSDFGYALVVGHANSDLQPMYPVQQYTSRIDIEEDIIATDFKQPVILKIKSVYQGNAAEKQRYQFQNLTLEKIKRHYLEYFRRFYDDISAVSTPSFEDDQLHNRFTIHETYRIDNYWKHQDSLIYSKIFNLSYIDTLKTPKVKQRRTPYYIGSPRQVNSILRLHYPENVVLNLDEEPVSIENPVLRYTYQDLYADGVYTHRSSLQIRQKDVPPGDMHTFLDSLDKIYKDWEYTLSVKPPDAIPGYRDLLTLKEHLKKLSVPARDE